MFGRLLLTAMCLATCSTWAVAQDISVAAETAGISGFRSMWDQPVVTSADGAVRLVDKGNFGKAESAVWMDAKARAGRPGALVFDAVHRSLLIRFPDAADQISARLRQGAAIEKVELLLPYKGTELWPEGYLEPAGMSFLGGQWRDWSPRWHAVAYVLRQPWSADEKVGPTFNAYANGTGYWAKYGARDPQHDRYPTRFGPAEVSKQSPQGVVDLTPVLTDGAYGSTLAERLRVVADQGVLVQKQETYDRHAVAARDVQGRTRAADRPSSGATSPALGPANRHHRTGVRVRRARRALRVPQARGDAGLAVAAGPGTARHGRLRRVPDELRRVREVGGRPTRDAAAPVERV
jgi:hypothetical protein